MKSKAISHCIILSYFLLLPWLSWSQANSSILLETFDNNNNQWPFIGSFDGSSLTIANGHLIMSGKQTAIHTYKDIGLNAESNFAVYSRLIFLEGNHEEWMGVRFGANADATQFCSFLYNNNKEFLITLRGRKSETLRTAKSLVIKAYDYNTLTVIKNGTTYKFLINDKQVHEEKIKPFFGPVVALMTNAHMKIQVDEIQVYDPKQGRASTVPSTLAPLTPAPTDIQSLVQIMDTRMPADFQEFYDSFEKFVYPYNYITVIERSRDITNLSFVRKKFFAYDGSRISNHRVSAIAHLADCQKGYAFLVANQYMTNNQEITQFSVEAFDKTGKSIGSKDVGSFVKEKEGYFKTLNFKVSKDGNSIFIDATETFYNGNQQKNSVGFNIDLCNL